LALEEIQRRLLDERGQKAGLGSVWQLFDRHGISFAADQDRPVVVAARNAWTDDQGKLDPDCLVFIDETGTSTNMARLRGRAPRGERLVGKIPHGHWKTTTFVAALCSTALTAPCVIDGPIPRLCPFQRRRWPCSSASMALAIPHSRPASSSPSSGYDTVIVIYSNGWLSPTRPVTTRVIFLAVVGGAAQKSILHGRSFMELFPING
jgi:hypothetical protein